MRSCDCDCECVVTVTVMSLLTQLHFFKVHKNDLNVVHIFVCSLNHDLIVV